MTVAERLQRKIRKDNEGRLKLFGRELVLCSGLGALAGVFYGVKWITILSIVINIVANIDLTLIDWAKIKRKKNDSV